MPRIIETTVFTFEELSDSAKDAAREWWKDCENQDFWPDSTIEDAVTVAAILGIDISDHAINMGRARSPDIHWSVSYCQGDGAMFQGHYKNNKTVREDIDSHAPQDKVLHAIAEDLFTLQAKHFGLLFATCSRIDHHYSHSGCMGVEMGRYDDETGILATVDYPDATPEALAAWAEDEKELTRILRRFADWIHAQIIAEYEWTMGDENVDECITINAYEFTAEGAIA